MRRQTADLYKRKYKVVLTATVKHHLPVADLFNLICVSGTEIVAPHFLTYEAKPKESIQ